MVWSEDIDNYTYLNGIEIPSIDRIDSAFGIMIGLNVPKAMEPWDVIPSVYNGPFAVKPLLGWVIKIDHSKFMWLKHTYPLIVSMQNS